MLVPLTMVVMHVQMRDRVPQETHQVGEIAVHGTVSGVETRFEARRSHVCDERCEVFGPPIDPGVIGTAVLDRQGDPELFRMPREPAERLLRQMREVGGEARIPEIAWVDDENCR